MHQFTKTNERVVNKNGDMTQEVYPLFYKAAEQFILEFIFSLTENKLIIAPLSSF